MRPMPVGVAVSASREIPLHEIDLAEGRMVRVYPGVEDGDRDIRAGELRPVGANRRYPP